MYLICYDISSNKIRRKVSKVLEGYGRRVQYSAFECDLDKKDFKMCCSKITKIIDGKKQISLRCYYLDQYSLDRLIVLGDPAYDPEDIPEIEEDLFII